MECSICGKQFEEDEEIYAAQKQGWAKNAGEEYEEFEPLSYDEDYLCKKCAGYSTTPEEKLKAKMVEKFREWLDKEVDLKGTENDWQFNMSVQTMNPFNEICAAFLNKKAGFMIHFSAVELDEDELEGYPDDWGEKI